MLSRRVFVAGVGAAAGGGASAVAAEAASVDGDSVTRTASVMDFGARGDGLADDAPAIQAAVDSGAAVVVFPPGRYLVRRPLAPRPSQVWRGEGAEASILTLPAEDAAEPFNLIHFVGVIEDFAMTGLGLVGNVARQTVRRPDGQAAFAVYIRGALRRIRIERCRFSDFGEARVRQARATGGGAVILGPRPGEREQALEDVDVAGCVFTGNGNVPGVYVSAGDRPGPRRRNVRIAGNRFFGVAPGTRPQNCIYVLAHGAATRIDGVVIADNLFDIDTYVDACMELNWVESFAVTGNAVTLTGAVEYTAGLLLRDGCRAGTVSGNVFVDRSGEDMTTAVAMVNFQHPGTIEDVSVTGNTVRGFRRRGIAADRGVRGAVISGNRVSAGDAPTQEAIRVTDAEDVLISGNAVSGAVRAVVLAPGTATDSRMRSVTVFGNQFHRCGGVGVCLVECVGVDADVVGLTVSGNRAVDTVAGAEALVGGRFRNAGDNLVVGNFTGGLPPIRPADAAGFTAIRGFATGDGTP